MRIDIATLFPDMFDPVLNQSIVGRGIKNGFIEIHTHDIRLYTENKHNRVDDKPYGGGTGMLMQAQPIYDCIMAIKSQMNLKPRIVYMSPQGEVLTQTLRTTPRTLDTKNFKEREQRPRRRDGDRRQGGFNRQGGDRRQGGFNNNRQGGFNNNRPQGGAGRPAGGARPAAPAASKEGGSN